MNTAFLKRRSTRYGAYSAVYILLVIGILAAANWLANRYNKSVDLTANKRYSLAGQTVKIVSNLKEDVTVSYFDETTSFGRAKDLLGRYDNLSTKLSVEYIDPFKKPTLAKQFGVTQTGTIILRTAAGKRQEARSLNEEEITSALIRLLKTGERMICFTTGAGEHTIEESNSNSYSGVKDVAEKNNYKTQVVNLIEKPEVPAACTILVAAGPHTDYPVPVVEAMKKFVEGGGRALFMLDPPLNTGKERIAENAPLVDQIKNWGVTLNKNLILETSGIGQLYGMGPEVALASKYESHAIVRDLKRTATAFPIARSLEAKSADKTTVETLVSTTKNCVAATRLDAAGGITMPKTDPQSYDVAAAGTYRLDKSAQKPDASNPAGITTDGRFVVVGSSDWASNYALGFGGNRDLFMNMMNWLSSDEDLISIRPKDPEDRRIQLSRSQMLMVRSVSQFVFPIAVIAFGILVWWRRR